jgi:hypothetical protein
LRNNEFRRKETLESSLDNKSSSKSQDSSSKSYIECAKNGIGIAFAGALKAAEATMKITTAGLAIQAGLGMRGVEGSSTPGSGTELQVRGDDGNTTALHPYSEGAQTRPQREFNPDNVTPEVLEHFKKIGVKNPEKLIQDVKQGKYGGETAPELRKQGKNKGKESLKSNKEKIVVAQAWMEKAKANPSDPEVLRQGRNLLAKIKVEATRADATGPVDRMQHPYNRLPERYVPYKEFLEKMKKSPFYFGPKDAQATSRGETSQSSMETHQREQDKNKGKKHLSSNEKDIANLRALMEKAKDDPEVRQRVRKLIEVRQQQEQGRMLAEAPASDNTGTTVVLVHGFVGNGVDPVNCKGGYWGDAINYLKAQGYSDCRTVKFYNSDINCDVDLHDSIYAGPCSQYAQGSEGTNNESLDHVSCLLAQYLYQNFGKSNRKSFSWVTVWGGSSFAILCI